MSLEAMHMAVLGVLQRSAAAARFRGASRFSGISQGLEKNLRKSSQIHRLTL